jgi:hypothetical protein
MRMLSRRCERAAPLVLILLLPATVDKLAAQDSQPNEPVITFSDVTASSRVDFAHTVGDDAVSNIVEGAGGGCGFIDFDGDDFVDIYLVNGCWLAGVSDPTLDATRREALAAATDRLYRNRGDGTFEDVSEAVGVNHPGYGIGVIAADYDNDGDTDLYVMNCGSNFLYRNDGHVAGPFPAARASDLKFVEVAQDAGVADPLFTTAAAFVDYDRDGRLDLYVGNCVAYGAPATSRPATQPTPLTSLSFPPQPDHLYRGNADGTFADVTAAAGLAALPPQRTRNVVAEDFDRDGWPDLLVLHDGAPPRLLHNKQDGTFEDIAEAVGLVTPDAATSGAHGLELGDVNGDGWPDVLVTNDAGGQLFGSLRQGRFEDASQPVGLTAALGSLATWGAVLADFDLDTRLDLFLAGDATKAPTCRVLRGDAQQQLVNVTALAGPALTERRQHRGVAAGDFDDDGDVDLLINNLNAGPTLLRNDTLRSGRHWLTLSLRGITTNANGIGGRVRIHVGGQTQVQAIHTGGSYASQPSPWLHFGLGAHTMVDRVDVLWPNGAIQRVTLLPADTPVRVAQQPEGGWRRVPRAEEPSSQPAE